MVEELISGSTPQKAVADDKDLSGSGSQQLPGSPTGSGLQRPHPAAGSLRAARCTGARTAFLSAHAQFIVTAPANLPRRLPRALKARTAFAASPLPEERSPPGLPSSDRIAANQGRWGSCPGATSLIGTWPAPRAGTLKPLSPFVVAGRGITPGCANEPRLPCRARLACGTPIREHTQPACLGLRPEHRSASADFYSGHSPPLRHFTPKGATFTWLTAPGTGVLLPAAAEAPALVHGLRKSGHVARAFLPGPLRYVRAFRPGIVSGREHWRAPPPDFPLRIQKLGVPFRNGCSQFGTVSQLAYWQALPHLSGWAFHG